MRASLLVLLLTCLLLSPAATRAQPSSTAAYAQTLAEAEARTAQGAWADAAALWARVVAANPVNGRFWSQLGIAHYNARQYREAIPALEHAVALGWRPAINAYNVACTYALLGEKSRALDWLEAAFQKGFRLIEHARSDTDLLPLHDDPRYRALVGLPETAGTTREVGWRADLAFLAREVHRRALAPRFHQTLDDFDAAVAALDAAIPRLTDAQVAVELMKALRKVGDGHTGVLPTGRSEFEQTLPIQFYLFGDELRVISAAPAHRGLLGARVVRFGERPVAEVIAALDPLISRDRNNPMWVATRAPYLLRHTPVLHAMGLIPNPAEVSLAVVDLQGRARTVRVAADTTESDIWNVLPQPASWVSLPETRPAPMPRYLRGVREPYRFEFDPVTSVVYFQFNSIVNGSGKPFAAFSDSLFAFVEARRAERLVVDLRWNNGGNTALAWGFLYALLRSRVNRPGGLFVIIGRRTYSAAQNLATLLEQHTSAVFVGEPTGSSPNFVGDEVFFTLPYSGLRANVSDLYWQFGWPDDDRTWIAPRLYAPPTFEAYLANRDPAMEAITAYLAVMQGGSRPGRGGGR